MKRVAAHHPRLSQRDRRALWLAGFVAAVLLSVLAAAEERAPGDQAVTSWIQTVDFRGLDTISDVLFALGLWPAFVVVGAVVSVICWHARQRLAAAFAVLALLAAGTSWLLKLLIERPRPSADVVRVIGETSGYSFPSGHVLGAVLLWGFVFYVTPRVLANRAAGRAVRAVSFGVLLSMGFQRVYAGAHWPSDVLGGYLWGGLILALIIGAFEFSQRRPGSGVGPA